MLPQALSSRLELSGFTEKNMKVCLSVGAHAASGARVCGRKAARAIQLCAVLVLLCVASFAATLPSGFTETQITGLTNPTAMTFAPDGRLFICQQGGALRIVKNGALLTTPFMTLSVNSSGERGLLGIAFDPNFTTNNFIYVYYTVPTAPIHNRVSRFTASAANPDVVVAGSEQVILDLNNLSTATNHNGGAIHFGPDSKLYVAVGENANAANAQTFTNLLGKILRINTDPANVVPTDNPYFNDANVTGVNKAIWSLGLRNPFTFGFQPGTGRLFINDVGQNTWEEINEGVAHSNYGWSTCEGFCSPPNANFRDPLYEYNHTTGTPTGCAIVGAAFYNPPTVQFPAIYVGKYFFGDLCGGYIRYVDPGTGGTIPSSTAFATGISSPVDFQVSSDGSLWYLAGAGNGAGAGLVSRIQFPAGQVPPSITQQPADQTVNAGQTATFNVQASGATPLSYQWQRNNVDIPGANSSSYTTPPTTLADNGAQFRCIVSNAFNPSATSNNATLSVTAVQAGDIVISEFRNHGPDPSDVNLFGLKDDFVEFYNTSNVNVTVATTDGSAGWALVSADSTTLFVIPNSTVIPAHAHYLAVNPAEYSLGAYATGDLNFNPDLTQGIALFKTATPANFTIANRLDAVGFSGDNGSLSSLCREGTPITSETDGIGADEQFSYVRRQTSGTPQDTGDNATDFVRVCTCISQPNASDPTVLGAPGPENLSSSLQRNAQIKASLVDPQTASSAAPNRVRDLTAVTNGPQGTLTIRRKFTNKTGQPVTTLRFRIVDITTTNSPNPGGGAQADLRALDASDVTININGTPTLIKGTTIEQPGNLTQPQGGALNSSLTVALPGGTLAANAAVNVQFVLGVNGSGSFRFLVNVEALNGAGGFNKGVTTRPHAPSAASALAPPAPVKTIDR
jgi:glucose/arabinose dehydrogenase